MHTNKLAIAVLSVAAMACGAPEEKPTLTVKIPATTAQTQPPPATYTPPTQDQKNDARARVEAAIGAAHHARTALELVGILPTYTCGEPRRTFVGTAVAGLEAQVACVRVTTVPVDTSADQVVIDYVGDCAVQGHTLSGRTVFTYRGGEERMEVSADFHQTVVDGQPLPATVGYGTCGDETRYSVAVEGALPNHPEITFEIDGRVGVRDGLPLIGGTSLVLDGTAELNHRQGTDRVTFTGLEYELGEYLPRGGSLLVETSSGHRVSAKFDSLVWRLGTAELAIDDGQPFSVPIVH